MGPAGAGAIETCLVGLMLVGLDRLELSTSPLSGARSSHLSYRPETAGPGPINRPAAGTAAAMFTCFAASVLSRSGFKVVELVGIEPAAS